MARQVLCYYKLSFELKETIITRCLIFGIGGINRRSGTGYLRKRWECHHGWADPTTILDNVGLWVGFIHIIGTHSIIWSCQFGLSRPNQDNKAVFPNGLVWRLRPNYWERVHLEALVPLIYFWGLLSEFGADLRDNDVVKPFDDRLLRIHFFVQGPFLVFVCIPI